MTDGREDSEDILRFLASNVESIRDKVGGVESRLSACAPSPKSDGFTSPTKVGLSLPRFTTH